MTDLICRKSMTRCQTPGMCSPHGGCQPSALIETNVRYSASSGAGVTDTTELKRLAGALSRAIEQAEHKPGQWAETVQSMGGICLPGGPFQIGKPWANEDPWANFSYKRDSWLAVAAVNALPQLMALIAENERLAAQVRLAGVAAEMTVHDAVGRAANDYLLVCLERDQLKADVEALRDELGGVKAVSDMAFKSLKQLIFMARTSGGTAGPDSGLMKACEAGEDAISLGGIGAAYIQGADAAMSKEADHD